METPDSAPFSTVTRERCARNKGSGRETPGLKESFQKENRSGGPFSPPSPKSGRDESTTVASRSREASGLAALPSAPDARPKACTHPHPHPQPPPSEPTPGSPVLPAGIRPKAGPPSAGGAAGEENEVPALTDGLPTATAIAAAAPAAPRQQRLPLRLASPAPPWLLRSASARLLLADGSFCSPHAAAPPDLLEQHGHPPGRDHLLLWKGV